MATNAGSKVLTIPELLESILLGLDLEADPAWLCKLLFVSRDFNKAILESPRLFARTWIYLQIFPYDFEDPIYNPVQQNARLHNCPILFQPFNLCPSFQIDISLDRLRTASRSVEDCFQELPIARVEWWWNIKEFKDVLCPIMIGLNDSSALMSV